MTTPAILVRQMINFASDALPNQWQKPWRKMDAASPHEKEVLGYTLQPWLEEVYFDGEQPEDSNREEMRQVIELVGKMLAF